MALQLLDLGAKPNDETGTKGRSGGDIINDNFTELYSFTPSAALLVDGSVSGTDQLFTGHVGIGATASIKTNEILHLSETLQDDGGPKNAQLFEVLFTGSQLVGNSVNAFKGTVTNEATPTLLNTNAAIGLFFTAIQNSTSDMANLKGQLLRVSTASSTGAITSDLFGLEVDATIAATSGTIANAAGISINDMGQTNVTTASGINVDKQTNATNNYGIRLNGDDLGADITFGAGQDVRQHFNGTNLEFQGSGIAHTASTVTHDGYVTIAINGVAYNFMTGT